MLLLMSAGCNRSGSGAASSGGDEVSCPDGSAQPGVSIVTVNCSSLVQFDAQDLDASLDVEGLAAAGIQNTKKVLREVSDAAEEAQVQFSQYCEMYNACALSSEEFRERTDRAQSHFRSIREKVDILMSAGGDPAVVREAFAQLYTETVIASAPKDDGLLLELSVLGGKAGKEPEVLSSGGALHTGDRVVFGVRVSQESHVYLFQRKSSGVIEVLFPHLSIPNLKNPLAAAEVLRIPPEGQVFELDDQDLGEEVVYVVASKDPVADLEQALSARAGEPTPEGPVEKAMVRLFSVGAPECADRTRGLRIADADPCATMTRGLQVNSTSASFFSEDASVQSRNVPGDDVILQVFRFKHAP
jgi:hypothetical protein